MEFFLLFVWFALSLAVGGWNKSRGNSFLVGFLVSIIFSPLIGIIMVAITKTNPKGMEKEALKSGEAKKCPQCAELVKVEAVKCRFCGADLQTA